MTAFELQKELNEAIDDCLDELRFKNHSGTYIPISIYNQELPIKDDDDTEEPFPYILCRVVEGTVSRTENKIHIWLIIGIFDDDTDCVGYRSVLGVIQRIVERFGKNNTLEHFILDGDIKWTLQETDSYPYYFGGMEMDFITTNIEHQNALEGIYT